jgi:hypothetical protein
VLKVLPLDSGEVSLHAYSGSVHPCADAAKCQLAAAGVAAAWRLGQWDALPAYIERTDVGYDSLEPEDRWEVSRSCTIVVLEVTLVIWGS